MLRHNAQPLVGAKCDSPALSGGGMESPPCGRAICDSPAPEPEGSTAVLPSGLPDRRHAMSMPIRDSRVAATCCRNVAALAPRYAEIAAQCAGFVARAIKAASLQLGNDRCDKRVELARKNRRHVVEAIAGAGRNPLLHHVGHLLRRSEGLE